MGKQASPSRRQIRNYLIDRKMQLRFTAIMVVLSSLLTAGLGYVWYAEMRKASGVIRVNAMATLGEAATNQLEAELASQDRTRLLLLVGFAFMLAVLIAGYGIVMTHKLAGPLFKINRHMQDIENERLYELWDLRKGDQLQEFFATFKSMHGALRERTEADMKLLSKMIAVIDRGDDLKEEIPALRARLAQKGDSLRQASSTTQKLQRVDA